MEGKTQNTLVKEVNFNKRATYLFKYDAADKSGDKMLVMGASMDGKLLKEAAEAHHKAIAGVDSKGVLTAADYEAINAGLGKLIASVPQSQVMDVYNAFAKIIGNGVVANNLFQFSKGADAIGAYSAFLKFKDIVKAAQV